MVKACCALGEQPAVVRACRCRTNIDARSSLLSSLPASGRSEAYAIVGVLHTDAQGFPFYDNSDVSTVLHEMNHPYVTPLIRANAESLRLDFANG